MAAWNGSREVAFVLARAKELPIPPADWEDQVRARAFFDPAAAADLRGYVRAASYGKARLVGDVYGPFDVTAKRANGSWDIGNAMDQAVDAAIATGTVTGVTYFCVVFTDLPGPSHAFWNAGGGRCYVDMAAPPGVWAMENLHILTQFADLYGIPDSPGGFDVMDCACGTHPSAFTKANFGWLDPGAVTTVPPGKFSGQITLHALGSPLAQAPTPGRMHAIKVPAPTGQQYHLIEARLRVDQYEATTPGVSSGLPSEGVIVYWIDETAWPPVHRRAALSSGQTYKNANSGLELAVEGTVPLGFTVTLGKAEPPECAWIRGEIASGEADIRALQDDLRYAPPSEKPYIVAQIKQLQRQKALLQQRGQSLGCTLS
jgi:hypothetical protein